jgi:CheY-like chemotaxis protein
MSKAESGRLKLNPEPYYYSDFVGYIDAVVRPLCDDKDIALTFEAPVKSGVVPKLDVLRVNQIYFNLLSNAVKFTRPGGSIRVTQRERITPENRLNVSVVIADNGIGMSEEFQQVLFEPFTQENRDDISNTRGSGLGLAIVRKIIDAMGGSISVTSRVGEGTSFSFTFDCDYVEDHDPDKAKSASVSAADLALLREKHVLLCEDHPLNREIAETLLAEKGVSVDAAENGAEGVKKFAGSALNYYAAVLMDIRMPVMNGYEAAAAIRALSRADAKTTPIIAMTADAFADDIKKCLEVGMNAHIAKPIDPQTLYETLSRLLKEAHQA